LESSVVGAVVQEERRSTPSASPCERAPLYE